MRVDSRRDRFPCQCREPQWRALTFLDVRGELDAAVRGIACRHHHLERGEVIREWYTRDLEIGRRRPFDLDLDSALWGAVDDDVVAGRAAGLPLLGRAVGYGARGTRAGQLPVVERRTQIQVAIIPFEPARWIQPVKEQGHGPLP